MVVSTRAVLTIGLGIFSTSALVGPLLAQGRDAQVRKTANTPGAAPAAPKPAGVPVFGTVDLETVLKNYDKLKVQQQEFNAALMAKQKEMMKLRGEGQEEATRLQKMVPNSTDAKKIEDHLVMLKAQMEAGRDQAQRDFSLREAEMLVQAYKEVQAMVARIAEFKGLTYVMKVSSIPLNSNNPDSAMAEMSKTVMYSDPRNDITQWVIKNLNENYKAAGGVAPKATAPSGPGAASPATPSGN